MKTLRLRRVRLISAGKMTGFVCAFVGLLAAIPITLIALMGVGASPILAASGADHALAGAAAIGIPSAALGVGVLLGFPLAYGLFGFAVGFLHALVYNFIAGFVGGLVLEVE